MGSIQSSTMILCALGNRSASFLSRRAHLLTTVPKGTAVVSLTGRALSEGDAVPAGTSGRCALRCYRPHSWQVLDKKAPANCQRKTSPGSFCAVMGLLCADPFSF